MADLFSDELVRKLSRHTPVAAASDGAFAFKPVRLDDLPMLENWLARRHWRDWWGDPEIELGYIRDMIVGRDTTCLPFIFSVEGEPLGYIQVWRIGPHQTPEWASDDPWLMEKPPESVGVDISIADPAKLSRGVGSGALNALARKLAAEGQDPIIIDPDPDNRRAVAAYRRAGFLPVPHLEGRTQGVLIMQFQQDSRSE